MKFAMQTKSGNCTLMKIGQRSHLEDLRNGHLYMNPQSFFACRGGCPVRNDSREAIDYIAQPKDIKSITFSKEDGSKYVKLGKKHIASAFKLKFGNRPHYNLFCTLSVPHDRSESAFDTRLQSFHETAVIRGLGRYYSEYSGIH